MEELKKLTTRVAHVLPVSDDGGSTAEIVRVLGMVFLVTIALPHILHILLFQVRFNCNPKK